MSTSQNKHRQSRLLRACAHLAGILCLALVMMLALVGAGGAQMLWELGDRALLGEIKLEVLAHLTCAALVWGLGYSAWSNRRRGETRVLKAARGTVITETLITLIPFMLLTSGLAQFSINNMAGILTNAAAYQAGRTMWVWEPVNISTGTKRARVAAAAAVTPVAPGAFTIASLSSDEEMVSYRGIMFATSNIGGFLGGSNGAMRAGATGSMLLGNKSLTGRSMSDALDDQTMSVRAARKFTFAYLMTTVTPVNSGDEIGAKVVYEHSQAFPWFAWIFGTYKLKAARPGYYSTITRTYSLPKQVPGR